MTWDLGLGVRPHAAFFFSVGGIDGYVDGSMLTKSSVRPAKPLIFFAVASTYIQSPLRFSFQCACWFGQAVNEEGEGDGGDLSHLRI